MFNHRTWDHITDRMLNSPLMCDYLFLGFSADYGFPVIVPRRRDSPHTWVLGPSGSGKDSRFAAPAHTQIIAGGNSSLVVIDAKPDKALLLNCVIESARAGIPFRFFDLTPGRASYVFNPLRQSHLGRQTLNQRIETIMQALGLEYGADYGRGFFSAVHESFASDAEAKYNFSSFEEFAKLLLDPVAFRFIDAELWKAALHYRITIAKLAAIPPFNITDKTPGISPEVLAHAIDLRQLFYQRQVIYFILNSAEMRTTSRPIAGFAAYHLFAAAAREENKICGVDLVIDEGQEFVQGLSVVLDQARSMGINVTLIHQHMGQLKRSDQDYAETLENATGLQIVFSPTSQRVRKWIMDTAGTVTRPSVSWSQALTGSEAADDDFRLRYADAAWQDQLPRASVVEQEVRAISENDLIRWSANPRIALVRLVTDQGLSRYGGAWIPTLMSFHISPEEYAARRDAPWPEGGPGTIGVPLESDYDRRFKDGPRPSVAKQQLQERIRKIREQKEGGK